MARRPGLMRLMDKRETGDILVATKLDRLGRGTIDVSCAGNPNVGVIIRVFEFKRDLLIERKRARLNRAKSEGRVLGCLLTLYDKQYH